MLAKLGSRREMAEAIKHNRVMVNGSPAMSFKLLVNTAHDHVTLDGRPIILQAEESVYVMLNKPAGVLSTTSDKRGRRTVIDLLPREYRGLGLYPVGRLDLDSTGLIILTNDGTLTHRLTHPSFEKEKEYVIALDRALLPEDKQKFEQGLELEDGPTHPAVVRNSGAGQFSYSIVLHEGRKRQLRRMFASLGYRVLLLRRIRMGNLHLGNLPEGCSRQLSAAEIASLLIF